MPASLSAFGGEADMPRPWAKYRPDARTSNWAITVVGAMLSLSLSTTAAHHGIILFAMVLVLLLLVI
jgi:uncharacterized membrane protein